MCRVRSTRRLQRQHPVDVDVAPSRRRPARRPACQNVAARRTGRRSRSARRRGCRAARGARPRRARTRRAAHRAAVRRSVVPLRPRPPRKRTPCHFYPPSLVSLHITSEQSRRVSLHYGFARVHLDGPRLRRDHRGRVVDRGPPGARRAAHGGRILTPNVDILRQAQVGRRGPGVPRRRQPGRRRRHAAGLGQPAGRGTPLPERVTGSQPDLVAVRRPGRRRAGRSSSLGGDPAAGDRPSGAADRAWPTALPRPAGRRPPLARRTASTRDRGKLRRGSAPRSSRPSPIWSSSVSASPSRSG